MKKLSKILLVTILCFTCIFSLSGCNFFSDLFTKIIDNVVKELTTVYSYSNANTESRLVLSTLGTFESTYINKNGFEENKISLSGTYTEDDNKIVLSVEHAVNEGYTFGVLESSAITDLSYIDINVLKIGTALVPDYFVAFGSILVKEGEVAPEKSDVLGFLSFANAFGTGYHITAEQNSTIATVVAENANTLLAITGDCSLIPFELTADKITGFNTTALGNVTFQIAYAQGKTRDIICKVVPEAETEIDISSLPDYLPVGTTLESFVADNSLVYTAGGNDTTVPLQTSMISGWDSSTVKTTSISITYQGITEYQSLKFYDSSAIKTESFYIGSPDYVAKGESITPYLYSIKKTDGTSVSNINLPNLAVTTSAFDSNVLGAQTLTAVYDGVTVNKAIYVYDSTNLIAKSISTQNSKLTITNGVSDLASNVLTITLVDNSTITSQINTDMLINYDLSTAYDGQTVYVKYISGGYTFYDSLTIDIVTA